ncbi:restriction endonuclease [Limosilactobacillus reuteri]|uniref:restriction endonuclease n=1 Tax=Limosilactobacillus reuteri TaxID=1598 RepID=UPI0039BF811B
MLIFLIIHNEPAYKKYKQEKSNQKKNRQKRENKDLAESQVKEWFNQQDEKTQDELLNHLVKMNPYKFENLTVQLLSVMGYKGDEGQALVTQKSNDHGIDGIINQDPLGLQKVYLQVKRYAPDNSVQMPEITAFSGSIKLKHADRGVFITTSTFTQGAINAAKDLNITLVNGEMLTNLMIQYQVGVEVKEHYMTYKIDGNMF